MMNGPQKMPAKSHPVLVVLGGAIKSAPSSPFRSPTPFSPLWIRQMDTWGAWKPVPLCLLFDQQYVLFCLFSLLFSPFPSSLFQRPPFSTTIAKRKARADELEAQAVSTGYKKGAYQEKDSSRDNG